MASRTLIVSASVVALAGVLAVVNAVVSKAPPTCPEVVVKSGAHREPRNAAGQVRYCWPGMARCHCDSDSDCYALDGYVACTPLTASVDASTPRDVPRVDVVTPTDVGSARDVVVAVDVRPPADTGPAGPLPTVGGCTIFPSDSPWNQLVGGMPLHPNSAAIIADIQSNGDGTTLKADFGSSAQWGLPYIVVPQGQARVPITFVEYGDESDPGPYPIPSNAPVEFGNDHHVIVVEQGACVLYEMYHSVRSGTGWRAGCGAVFPLNRNPSRPLRWTSADQGGLPILAGLARYDEVAAGEIRHALRVTFSRTRDGFIAPASHPGGGGGANSPPMGLRMRLKASFNISGFTGQSRVILTALQRYGMIVADTGTNWYVSGATDPRWSDDDLHGQLPRVPGTAFEVVYTGEFRR